MNRVLNWPWFAPRSRKSASSNLSSNSETLAWLLAGLCVLAMLLLLAGPLLAILSQAFIDKESGQWGFATIAAGLAASGLLHSASNSVLVALASTALVLPLAYLYAAALTRTAMKCKGLLRMLALIPLLAPSLLPGIALVYLFGNQGMLKSWFPDGSIYGFWGIVIAQVFFTFPHALMILLTALRVADGRLYEAATALGAGPLRQWLTVTLPSVRYGLLSAAVVVFTLVVIDFGAAKVIGGQFNVLALEAYKQVIGQQNFARGAVIGVLLLIPALLSFVLDHIAQQKQQAMLGARAQPLQIRPHVLRDRLALLFCAVISGALLLILGTAVAAALIKLWPYQMQLSLAHFNFDDVDGGGWAAFFNSLTMSAGTALFGTVLVFCGAWLTEKVPACRVWRQPLHLLAMLPMAVPGLVLGLGYVFFFNHPANPLHGLYGTMTILILCSIAHFYTTAHLTAVTALKQLDREFEAVAASLKVPFWLTAWRVTLPVCLPAVLEIARYFFVGTMTTVSAVVFIYTPDTMLASVSVLNMDDAGDTAAAAAMATMIVLSSALACAVFALLSYCLQRKSQAWRLPAKV
ncbi:putative 2-aminoethylphosphonate ABC transporter permease subunit [Chitinibacter bivalviorum]|uniref:Putative 2-aminoethylphosphonate ABC transporter permease subunit n=1 Tax=Chitinibacter bivalviorum TaxID=2739434 RepID=A0A7H9BDP8_9NEIS|nr:putative 2-aminoethylphosphonate ABC transporter permease subunit [Chitinibacter bivalviorum]QLG86833.1 putative 2-aminoethylphosphonate ABC transporter permease subunit [Chitinibacter bivalviorum]